MHNGTINLVPDVRSIITRQSPFQLSNFVQQNALAEWLSHGFPGSLRTVGLSSNNRLQPSRFVPVLTVKRREIPVVWRLEIRSDCRNVMFRFKPADMFSYTAVIHCRQIVLISTVTRSSTGRSSNCARDHRRSVGALHGAVPIMTLRYTWPVAWYRHCLQLDHIIVFVNRA